MSFYDGFPFFLCLIMILLPAVILGIMEKPLRYYQLCASILVIGLVLHKNPAEFLNLILFYVLSVIVVKGYLAIRRKYGRVEILYYLAVLLGLLPLILCKVAPLFRVSWFGFLGISYLTFRSVQVIIEIYDGVIREVPLVEFTAFLLFFPSFSSGPIDRSRRFHEDWSKVLERKEYLTLLGDGVFKILLGMVYKIVIAATVYRWMAFLGSGNVWYLNLGYAYTYGIYLFFDFAGCSLMAAGTAYILGVRLPDNFKASFVSKDLKEFCDRWHITLSHWFRDFIFTRFIMKCVKKKWFHTRLQRASVGFIINMGIMGVWHGLTPSYIVYGLYHGVILALTEIYQKKSKFYKKNKKKKWYQAASWFVTMQIVFFGFFIFSGRFFEVI